MNKENSPQSEMAAHEMWEKICWGDMIYIRNTYRNLQPNGKEHHLKKLKAEAGRSGVQDQPQPHSKL